MTGFPVPTISYQWKSGEDVVGTDSSTYTVVPGDAGKDITVNITATNAYGPATGTSDPTANVVGSSNANLTALALSTGSLSTTFDSATTSYNASVANTVASGYTVTPTKSDSNASFVQYLGASGTNLFTGALAVGANIIRTVVTAQDGTTTKTYTVTVTRASNPCAPKLCQTITFPRPANMLTTTADQLLSATSTSGLPMYYLLILPYARL